MICLLTCVGTAALCTARPQISSISSSFLPAVAVEKHAPQARGLAHSEFRAFVSVAAAAAGISTCAVVAGVVGASVGAGVAVWSGAVVGASVGACVPQCCIFWKESSIVARASSDEW